MDIKQLDYNNSDEQYFEIIDFLVDLGKVDDNLFWDSGRMNFWKCSVHGGKEEQDDFFRENAKLWTSENKIIGLCISEYGKNDIFLVVHPNYRHIYDDMFNWIENIWGKKKETIEVDVFEKDEKQIEQLKKHGYKFKKHYENLRSYDMDKVDLNYRLEKGFSIQAFHENMNFDSRVAVVKSAFNNDKYSKKNLISIHSSEDYIKDLDLCVVSPEGQIVAYCIGWRDKNSEASGYIEPVGTHSDFRRRGFASSVIKECFSRMKAIGMNTVEIASRAEPNISNFLYDSLKPVSKKKVMKYYKKQF